MDTQVKLEHEVSFRWLIVFALTTILSSIFFQSVYDCGRDFCGKMGGSDGVASLMIIWYA